jgi:DNA invertase Pin-like site-specific DNA recombinase
MTSAIAYLRTSSAANVGGDSDVRQRIAIQAYAKAHGIELVGEFYDAAVSGADPVETRAGFAAMLDRIEGNCVRMVIVEDASRFARDLVAQELGVLLMQQRGVKVMTAGGDDMTNSDDPTRIMMRQIAGAFAQYEKARLVGKLKAARDRKSTEGGKRIEGRKGHAVHRPEIYDVLRTMLAADPNATAVVLANGLYEAGLRNDAGKPIAESQVFRMLAHIRREQPALVSGRAWRPRKALALASCEPAG